MKNWKRPHCKQCHSVQAVLPSFSSGCGVLGTSFVGTLPVTRSAVAERVIGRVLELVVAGWSRGARLAFSPSIAHTSLRSGRWVCRRPRWGARWDPKDPHHVLWSLASEFHECLSGLFFVPGHRFRHLLLTKGSSEDGYLAQLVQCCPGQQCLRRNACGIHPLLSLGSSQSSFWHVSLTAANKSSGW